MAFKQWRTLALILTAFALGSVLLAACIRPGTASVNTGTSSSAPAAPACPSGTTVQTGVNNFEQSCIALTKGGTLTITPAQASYHQLDYGQWNGSTAQPETPSGVPTLKDLQLTSSSVKIGPFTTAGTYHIYCTVHPGMNLTVMVK
jgi:plastocyanin